MNNVRILAAKITTAAISLAFISPIPVVAGIPVVDGTN